MIYFDNAATTLKKPQQVIDAVVWAMQNLGNASRGAHEESLCASRRIFQARERLAGLFSCSPDRVCFASNSTEALNIAISGLFTENDHVITTDCEHNSVLRPLYRLRERGMGVSFVPADEKGRVDYADFERLIEKNTKAIVCQHASNLTGNVLELEKIGEIAKKHGLLFVVDASQTAGVLPIHMQKMHIDVLCFTGHKSLLGPQGTGGLCVADGVQIAPWKVGGTGVQTHLEQQPPQYPTRLEAGTLNAHGICGLSAALEYIESVGLGKIFEKETALAQRFYRGVKDIPGVTVYGDMDAEVRVPIVTLNLEDYDSGELADCLQTQFDIAVRPGAHCAPRLHRALGTEQSGSVRFSFGYFNTFGEVDAAVDALRQLAKK